jgi:nitrate/TMAO reductase-like tetraheme cytochrome c subunit
VEGSHGGLSQAKDLDVWRVTDEGMKNGTKKEKQFDIITKSIILSSLDVGVFNRVFTCENAHELWKTIKEQNESSKEVANEPYGCLLEEFNSFKQLANENAESMYSRLNVLVRDQCFRCEGHHGLEHQSQDPSKSPEARL